MVNMTKRTVNVAFNGKMLEVVPGTSVETLLGRHPVQNGQTPLGAVVNKRLMGLYYRINGDCAIDLVYYNSKEGANIYRRTCQLLLLEAVKSLYPDSRLVIGQSLANGYYFAYYGKEGDSLTDEMLEAIEKEMQSLVAADIPLEPELISTEDARAYYEEQNAKATVDLLGNLLRIDVPMVTIRNTRHMLFGPVAASTRVCKQFSLERYNSGLVLRFPNRKFGKPAPMPKQDKLFSTYLESRRWNEEMGVWNVAQLNRACVDGSISEVIKIAEGFQERKIVSIADKIQQEHERIRLILISGPSSSGKTTFTKRLAIQLRVSGLQPVSISLDNYYVDRVKTPKNPDGTYDFECLEALDVELFNQHLLDLLDGKEIQSPIYDFQRGERLKDKFIPISLGPDQVLLTEGIHCLNEKLSHVIAPENKFKIYISALTQLAIDDHNRIFTSDTRLVRRIVRDRHYRGYSATQTITQWPHVRAGEAKYIFPYQESADVMFNSALIYEPAIMKLYAKRYLMEVDRDNDAYTEAYRLFLFLDHFLPVFPEEVPPTSLLREFIGGSSFRY